MTRLEERVRKIDRFIIVNIVADEPARRSWGNNMKRKSTPSAYSAPIVSKAMRVLKMIVTAPKNPGISEIAARLSLAKSTTHGILAALEESGWVLRDPVTRKYTAGHAVKNVGEAAKVRVPLVPQARPLLERLSNDLDEDVFLGIFTGHHILILDQIESSKELKVTAKPGTRLPIYAGSAGKIFLAYLEPDVLTRLMRQNPLRKFTPRSITDEAAYLAELKLVRKAGIARDMGEYLPNVGSVAAPIFHGKKYRQRMVAGFWLVGLDWHLVSGKMEAAEKLALRVSEALSAAVSNSYGDVS